MLDSHKLLAKFLFKKDKVLEKNCVQMCDYVMSLYDIFKQNKVTKDYKKFTVLQKTIQNENKREKCLQIKIIPYILKTN